MAENKTKATKQSVSAFLDSVADETRRKDGKALAKLMAEITGEKPTMWGPSIVGFGACHYKYESGREGDMPIVAFSPRKANLVLYLMLGFGDYGALLAKLGKHKAGKGCLYINKLADVKLDVLRELVAASAAATREKYS
jgi:Domain of unknown function (DU1801)